MVFEDIRHARLRRLTQVFPEKGSGHLARLVLYYQDRSCLITCIAKQEATGAYLVFETATSFTYMGPCLQRGEPRSLHRRIEGLELVSS